LPQENTNLALAINLADHAATVLLPASDLAAILTEVRGLRADFDRFKKNHTTFAVRTTNEIDALFAKVDYIQEVRKPGKLTERRLKKLDYLLASRSNEAMTFSEIGKILELGSRSPDKSSSTRRQSMTKLGKILASKPTVYEVTDSKTQKGAKLVKLTKGYYQHCKKEFFGV
jgi:hypothetical protein